MNAIVLRDAVSNLQDRNVGNIGDIIKHQVLRQACAQLRARAGADRVVWVDTHTYKLFGKSAADGSPYLCSSGIAAAALRPDAMVCCERHDGTRVDLAFQAGALGLPVTVLPRFEKMATAELPAPGAVMALIDPFARTDEEFRAIWEQALAGIRRLRAPGAAMSVVFYMVRPVGVAPVELTAPDLRKVNEAHGEDPVANANGNKYAHHVYVFEAA